MQTMMATSQSTYSRASFRPSAHLWLAWSHATNPRLQDKSQRRANIHEPDPETWNIPPSTDSRLMTSGWSKIHSTYVCLTPRWLQPDPSLPFRKESFVASSGQAQSKVQVLSYSYGALHTAHLYPSFWCGRFHLYPLTLFLHP